MEIKELKKHTLPYITVDDEENDIQTDFVIYEEKLYEILPGGVKKPGEINEKAYPCLIEEGMSLAAKMGNVSIEYVELYVTERGGYIVLN